MKRNIEVSNLYEANASFQTKSNLCSDKSVFPSQQSYSIKNDKKLPYNEVELSMSHWFRQKPILPLDIMSKGYIRKYYNLGASNISYNDITADLREYSTDTSKCHQDVHNIPIYKLVLRHDIKGQYDYSTIKAVMKRSKYFDLNFKMMHKASIETKLFKFYPQTETNEKYSIYEWFLQFGEYTFRVAFRFNELTKNYVMNIECEDNIPINFCQLVMDVLLKYYTYQYDKFDHFIHPILDWEDEAEFRLSKIGLSLNKIQRKIFDTKYLLNMKEIIDVSNDEKTEEESITSNIEEFVKFIGLKKYIHSIQPSDCEFQNVSFDNKLLIFKCKDDMFKFL